MDDRTADLFSYNPSLPGDPMSSNVLFLGVSGSGVSSLVNTLATAVQPSNRTTSIVKSLARMVSPSTAVHKSRQSTALTKYALSQYLSGLKVNTWESWGLDVGPEATGNNYESLELDLLLKGFLP